LERRVRSGDSSAWLDCWSSIHILESEILGNDESLVVLVCKKKWFEHGVGEMQAMNQSVCLRISNSVFRSLRVAELLLFDGRNSIGS
jgi:hypothetical protein